MEKLFDRIVIFILSVFAMSALLAGKYLVVVVDIALAFLFLDYALCGRIQLVLQLCLLAGIAVWSDLAVLLPLLIYSLTATRNAWGFCAAFLTFWAAAARGLSGGSFYYLFFLMLISGYLCVRSEKYARLSQQHKSLRDDFSIRRDQLTAQQQALIQARDQEVETAQLQERNRIAREIHDHVGHMLTRALLQMGALLTIYPQEPMHSQLEEVRSTLDTAMTNIRTSVHDLHDESIDVSLAIRQIAQPLQEKYQVRLELDASNHLPREVKYAILGITREAVSNIVKHSQNDCVDITLIEHPSMLQLVIWDYSHQETDRRKELRMDQSGIGLENIRSRAEGVQGNVSITHENGFRIFITIPRRW